jgi:hypothetical protein
LRVLRGRSRAGIMAVVRKKRMSKRSETNAIVPLERITQAIFLSRSQKVMVDSDLAALYGVPTKVLVQAVKRNIDRFPNDFMFQLTAKEFQILRSQTVTSRGVVGELLPTPSPSKASRCSPACCRAPAR